MSLKLKIYEAIKQVYPKPYPIDEVFGIADLLGHKQSLAERKCRELVHSGLIRAIKNDKGYNTAYLWIKSVEEGYIDTSLIKTNNFKLRDPITVENPFKFRKVQNRLGFTLPPVRE